MRKNGFLEMSQLASFCLWKKKKKSGAEVVEGTQLQNEKCKRNVEGRGKERGRLKRNVNWK